LGATVAIGDIDESAVEEAGSRLGLKVRRRLDVTDRQSFTEFLETVEDQLGPIDVMVNNAGVIAVGSAVDEDDTVTGRVLDVNIYGVILGTKLAAQRMLPRGKGHIINIASLGGVLPAEGIATYCATKHAVLGYTDTVRMENRGSGVHFSAILPTLTNTEMIAGVGHTRGFKNAEPDDVARAIAGVIAKPKARVFVPRSLGVAVATQRFMPRRVAEAMARASGKGRVFTSDVEVDKRTAYARRTGTS
jgi:short-subunit dehydrogenase